MRTIINFVSSKVLTAGVTINQLQGVADDITRAGKGVGFLFLTIGGALGTVAGLVIMLYCIIGLATSKNSNQGKYEKHKEDLPSIIFFTIVIGIFTTWAGATYFS